MKRPRPDTRPSWRDPSLPCIRDYRFANGKRMVEVEPDYERRYREHMLAAADLPYYYDDPTYDLKRKA